MRQRGGVTVLGFAEAISSRLLLLHSVATQTRHGGQARFGDHQSHAKQAATEATLTHLAGFLATLKANAAESRLIDHVFWSKNDYWFSIC